MGADISIPTDLKKKENGKMNTIDFVKRGRTVPSAFSHEKIFLAEAMMHFLAASFFLDQCGQKRLELNHLKKQCCASFVFRY